MALLSEKEQFEMMMDQDETKLSKVVRIDNPKTKEF